MLNLGTTENKPKVDYRLRNISVRSMWGCERFPDTVIRAADNEFLMGAGNRVCLFDISAEKNIPAKHIFPAVTGVVAVHSLALSKDSRYMAVAVKMDTKKDVNLIVYDLKNSMKHYQGLPKAVHYEEVNAMGIPTHFSSLCFSGCSTFIAAVPTPSQYGIIIFDWQRDSVVQTIPVKTSVSKVLFNPSDSSRVVMVGTGGLFQFWRYTTKTIHAAPIVGIPKSHHISYVTCSWLSDDKVVAGTECGRIILVLNCQCQMILYPFVSGSSGPTSVVPSAVPSTLNTARESARSRLGGAGSSSGDAVEEISYTREYRAKAGGKVGGSALGKFPSSIGALAAVSLGQTSGGAADGSARPGLTPALSMADLSLAEDGHQEEFGVFGEDDDGMSSSSEEELLNEDEPEVSPAVVSVIVHGDIVAVASEGGRVTVYVSRMAEAAGGHGASCSLVLLARFSLAMGSHTTCRYLLHGMTWCVKSPSNYDVLCVSSTGVQVFDLKKAVDAKNMAESMAAALSFQGIEHKGAGDAHKHAVADNAHELTTLAMKRLVSTYHCGKVHSLSLATRMTLMATASVDDETVRLWNYNDPSGPGLLIEGYGDKSEELPSTIDLHPSGRFVAFGCDDSVREYAVTEGKYELMRRMPTKVAVTTPAGEPYMNNAGVSLVRYSHGGHLMAVVTGRLVQIYQLYVLDFTNSADDKAGSYNRLMAMTDHSSNITDLTFSADDEKIYTSSVDGSVYEWNVSASTCTRQGDYIWKGACATKVVSLTSFSDDRVTGTADSDGPRGQAVKKKKTSIMAVYEIDQHQVRKEQKNKLKRQTSRSTLGGGGGGSNRGASMRSTNSMGISKGGLLGAESPKGTAVWGDGLKSGKGSARNTRVAMGGGSMSIGNVAKNIHNAPVFGNPPGAESHMDSGAPSRVPSAGRKRTGTVSEEHVPSAGCYIAQWDDHISVNVKLIEVEAKVTAVALARIGGNTDPVNIAVLGCSDGRVIISTFPFITLVVSVHANASFTTMAAMSPAGIAKEDSLDADEMAVPPPLSSQNSTVSKLPAGTGSKGQRVLFDISTCKVLVNHSQRVTQVAVSQSGLWIFSTSEEGSVFMLSTSNKAGLQFAQGDNNAKTGSVLSTRRPSNPPGDQGAVYFENLPEYAAAENLLVMTDRSLLISQNSRIDDLSLSIDDSNAANLRAMNQLTEKKDTLIAELEATLKREIEKRDAIIINGRDEHGRHARALNEQIAELKRINHQNTKALEVGYEKRLAKEQLSYQELRQYLDEFACHARLDIEKAKSQVAEREMAALSTQNAAISDSEAQKAKLLMYNEYVKERYTEIIDALERSQEEERHKLKMEIQKQTELVEEVQTRGRTEVNQLRRTISLMKSDVEKKDMQLLSMQTDLDWARERINRLESGLTSASNDLKLKIETAERWEFKSGDQQQQIIELERIRKALTSQLHTLRQELVPKEEKIIRMSEQLQEIDREYEQSLSAVSDKEMSLKQKSAKLHVLQKQVSQLRYALSRKDGSLHRAAKLFDEYKHAMQKARFDSVKQPNTSDSKGTANRITDDLMRASSAKGGGGTNTDSGGGGMQMLGGDDKPVIDKNGKETMSASALAQVIGGPAAKENTAIMKRTKDSKEYVEVVVITDTMERSWRRMGDILEPYLKAPAGMAEEDNSDVYQSELEAFEAEKQRQMLLMQRSITGLKGNIELTNLVTANKVNGHLKDNKNLLFEVNSMRHELREYTLENQKLKAQIESMELRQKFKDEQMQREKAAAKKRMKLGHSGGYFDQMDGGHQHPHQSQQSHSSTGKPPTGNNPRPNHLQISDDNMDDGDWHHPNRLDAWGLKHKDSTDVHDPHQHQRQLDPQDLAGISPDHVPTPSHALGGENRQFARSHHASDTGGGTAPHYPNAMPHHHQSHPHGPGMGHGREYDTLPATKFADSNFTSIQGSRRESEISLEGFEMKPLTVPSLPEHSRESIGGSVSPPPPLIPGASQAQSEVASLDGNGSVNDAIDLSSVGGSVGGSRRDAASRASDHILVAVTQSPTNIAPLTGSSKHNPKAHTGGGSSYQSKLDMIDSMMLENSREIQAKNYTSAAAEILDKYSTKFSASGEVISNTFGGDSSAVTAGINKAVVDNTAAAAGAEKRRKATKNIALNDVIKFPTINTSNSFEMKHSSSGNFGSKKGVQVQTASTSALRHSNSARGTGWKRNNP